MEGTRVVLSWPTCKGDQLGYGGEKGEGGRGVGGCTRRCGWRGRDSGGNEVVRRTALIRLFGAAAAAWVSRWAVRACGSDWRGRGVVEAWSRVAAAMLMRKGGRAAACSSEGCDGRGGEGWWRMDEWTSGRGGAIDVRYSSRSTSLCVWTLSVRGGGQRAAMCIAPFFLSTSHPRYFALSAIATALLFPSGARIGLPLCSSIGSSVSCELLQFGCAVGSSAPKRPSVAL